METFINRTSGGRNNFPGRPAKAVSSIFLTAILLLFFTVLSGQPAVEWYNQTDVGEAGEFAGDVLADWIFDIITTEEGNYLAVGFGLDDEAGSSHERTPAFALYGPHGHLLDDQVVGEEEGQFVNVAEGENHYYAVGYQDDKAFLVRIGKDDLEYDEYPLVTSFFTPATAIRSARFGDVMELECDNVKRVFTLGYATDDTGRRRRWIASYEFDQNGDISLVHEWVSAQSSLREEMHAFKVNPQQNGTFLFYTVSQIQKNLENISGIRHDDYDIRVQKFIYDCSEGFTPDDSEDYKSIPWSAMDQEAFEGDLSGSIFDDFPPDDFNDEYPYGPKYLNTGFEREFDNCNESSPNLGLYIEDWADGSEDVAFDFVDAGDELVVVALLNRLEMWSFNKNLGKDTGEGLVCTGFACHDYESEGYLWGECYLLFIDKDDLSFSKDPKHLGTFSGGDFRPKLVQMPDEGFAVIGTISGCMDQETEPVEGFETFLVVKTDASGNVEWRKSIKGPEEGSCGFGIANTRDDGLVLAGNLADRKTVGQTEVVEEDYLVVKLGPEPCGLSGDLIEANYTDNYYVISDTENPEVWDSDLTVTARVLIMPGAELVIDGGPSSPVVISFADSEDFFDFEDKSPIGIRVSAGGKLTVENAILTGTECNGITRMWDGISVEGRPDQAQNNTYQGYCSLEDAIVENARFGLAASEVWMQQTDVTRESTGGESTGVLYKSSLTTGAKGGARIATLDSEFLNNYRSVHFTRYLYEPNQSAFYNTDFTSDGPLADPDLALRPVDAGQSFDHNEPRGTYIHASVWSTRLRFAACNFSGSSSIISDFRPRGIESDDALITATGGTMSDLLKGVWCRSLSNSLLASVELSGVDFDKVLEGVRLGGTAMDRITHCTFTNIPLIKAGDQEPYGIYAENAKGFRIYGNTFSGAEPGEFPHGLVVENSMVDGGLVKENQFETIRYGNQFLGDNGFLSVRCNDYTDIGLSAWSVLPNDDDSGELADQGAAGTEEQKADNEFFDECDYEETGYSHIYSDEIEFEYHDKTGNPNPAVEDCVTDPPVDLEIANDLSGLECDPEDPEDPPCSEPSTPALPSPYPPCNHLSAFMVSDQGLEARNRALRSLLHPGVDSLDNLLPYDIEDALEVLETRNEPEDKALRVGTLLSLGRYEEAGTLLDSIYTLSQEYESLVTYLAALLEDEAPADSISQEAYEDAMEALEDDNAGAQVLAQNLRYFRELIYTPVHPVIVEELEERSLGQLKILDSQETSFKEAIYPNPFTQSLIFDLKKLNSNQVYRISLYDSMGRMLWETQSQGDVEVKWTPVDLKPGVYFYFFDLDGLPVRQGKAIKM